MNKDYSEYRRILIALVLVAAASIAAFTLLYLEGRQQRESRQQEAAPPDPELMEVQTKGEQAELELYFYVPSSPKTDGLLLAGETRSLYQSDDSLVMARQIISEVLRGSDSRPNVFPPAARLRQLYLLEDGTAVVDLSLETSQQLAGGALDEYWALRSLSRSLTANLESVQRVKFLVGGQDRPTFAGHISIREPFM